MIPKWYSLEISTVIRNVANYSRNYVYGGPFMKTSGHGAP
jgi:hypothetical protein